MALSANYNRSSKGAGDLREYLVADNVHIYKGALVNLDSSGYARPARDQANEICIGYADDEFDNTITGHAAGGRDARGKKGVPVVAARHVLMTASGTATQGSVGQPFFVEHDGSVRAAAGNGVLAGIVTEYVSATSVWVFVDLPTVRNVGPTVVNGLTVATGDIKDTAGNLRLGAISPFATTEPTSAVVMKTGTAPVGAIATSGGLFSSATVVRKIIADGTVSNVET